MAAVHSRFRPNLVIPIFVAVLLLTVAPSFVHARWKGDLVLATSAEDPALQARLVALSPNVSRDEARRVTYISYTTGRELAKKWKMGASPTVHSFLINIGIKKAGYCYQFATELLLRLNAEKLKTLDLHWGESDAGTDTEHNVIVVTAKGQPFAEGILLDNWRHAGQLLWGPINGDPSHTWQENKDAANRRLNQAAAMNRQKRQTKPAPKTKPKSSPRPLKFSTPSP